MRFRQGCELRPLIGGQVRRIRSSIIVRVLFSSARADSTTPTYSSTRRRRPFDEAIELVFRLIQRLHPLAERRLSLLEDGLEPGALLGGQGELTAELLVLPPLTALGQRGRASAGHQDNDGNPPGQYFRDFHG